MGASTSLVSLGFCPLLLTCLGYFRALFWFWFVWSFGLGDFCLLAFCWFVYYFHFWWFIFGVGCLMVCFVVVVGIFT